VTDRSRRRSSKPFQIPPSSSTLTNPPHLPDDIARHQKILSRSLMDGISQRPSRSTRANFADRKQNSAATSSTFAAVDVASKRGYAADKSLNSLAAGRPPQRSPRSASDDRQVGNSSRGRTIVDGHCVNNISSHRSRPVNRDNPALSRSLMTGSTFQEHRASSGAPASSSTYFDQPLSQTDRRRLSILQWTSASCNGREIFC